MNVIEAYLDKNTTMFVLISAMRGLPLPRIVNDVNTSFLFKVVDATKMSASQLNMLVEQLKMNVDQDLNAEVVKSTYGLGVFILVDSMDTSKLTFNPTMHVRIASNYSRYIVDNHLSDEPASHKLFHDEQDRTKDLRVNKFINVTPAMDIIDIGDKVHEYIIGFVSKALGMYVAKDVDSSTEKNNVDATTTETEQETTEVETEKETTDAETETPAVGRALPSKFVRGSRQIFRNIKY